MWLSEKQTESMPLDHIELIRESLNIRCLKVVSDDFGVLAQT